MEKLDLATYGKEIKSNYDAVVSGDKTYAIYTTLKDSSLKPTALGEGDINEFVSEFEEGSVQFGILRVNPFGSDVQKLVLLGWCPDSAPIKSKVSYATNFANVGKLLHYHVDVTARDSDDLDTEDILKRVSNASGARYSIQSLTPQKASSSSSSFKPTPKPASKPATPEPVSKPAVSVIKPKPSVPVKVSTEENDGWGDEKAIEERDFSKQPLENVPSAYKPTKVDINALRNQEQPKVATLSMHPSGGLTSMPKPKTSNSVLSRYNTEVVKPSVGTKAPVFGSTPLRDTSKLVGGLSRNFGASNGKTPAQLWAEKKGQYVEVEKDDQPVNSSETAASDEDVSVNNVKDKFEKIHLESENEKAEEEEGVKPTHVSSFPPAPRIEKPESAAFPPPPKRDAFPPPPKRDAFSKFEDNEEEDGDDGWDDEEKEEEETKPAFTPVARSLPPRPAVSTPEEPSEEVSPQPTSRALPPRPSEPVPAQEQAPTTASEEAPTASKTRTIAVAEYEYEKDEDNEIGFTEGELIVDIEFVDEDWWQGTNAAGETGLFPATYVKIQETAELEEDPAPAPASEPEPKPEPVARSLPPRPTEPVKPCGPSAVAEYDYDASEDNELSFKEGNVITDIDQVDDDWWLGSFNGERKLFPANYVKMQ